MLSGCTITHDRNAPHSGANLRPLWKRLMSRRFPCRRNKCDVYRKIIASRPLSVQRVICDEWQRQWYGRCLCRRYCRHRVAALQYLRARRLVIFRLAGKRNRGSKCISRQKLSILIDKVQLTIYLNTC